ncbi:hypothetical protein Acsp04_52370 [Actinomadura sp. NBRC 104425]|uniref:helix-turn-helix transcriptional regulator n=1 Tax=Actinomadura sp. NBRC 104425 TaxID=3032204 RepID=UPI00249FA0EF|nr:helix-turn-helix transcriptional regulator [Actinomadura sp. NBRC 104425]GLZ15002.1 hypothetical protein Acsp04_52370 [Actinomadura sp. NBRC 104425]
MDDRLEHVVTMISKRLYTRLFLHLAGDRPNKAIARATGCTEAYISMIKSGERLPSLDMSYALDKTINAEGCLFEVRRQIESLRQEISAHRRTLKAGPPASGKEQDPVKRRDLLQDGAKVTAGATVAPVLAALTQAWQSSEPKLPGASVSKAMIDDWGSAYDIHALSYRIDLPEVVLAALADDWSEMSEHLERWQPDGVRRDLSYVAARHAYLIAGTWLQVGNRRQANRWWLTARELADRSGSDLLSGLTREWEANMRTTDKREDLRELLALTEEALRLVGGQPSVERMQALGTKADLLALMGRHDEALAAIRQAEDVFERIPATAVSREHLLRYEQSFVYSLIGDEKNATKAQEAARNFYRADEYATFQLRFHAVMLRAPSDPTEAASQAVRILNELPPERRVLRIRVAGRRVLDAIPAKAQNLPPVQELRNLTSDA